MKYICYSCVPEKKISAFYFGNFLTSRNQFWFLSSIRKKMPILFCKNVPNRTRSSLLYTRTTWPQFVAHSYTSHQIEIFAQEFEPASYFCDWTCVHLGMRRQKSPKFDFQSQFSMSKISFIILIFVSVKIIRLGVQLMIYQFLITSFFEVVYFLKLGPIFVASYPSERKSNHKNN